MSRKMLYFIILALLEITLFTISLSSTTYFDYEIISISSFFLSVSKFYYILLLLNIFLMLFLIYKYTVINNSYMLIAVFILLLYTFTIDYPRMLFTHPFQAETFKQAKTFIVLKTGFFHTSLEPDSIGEPFLSAFFILVTKIPSFEAILYILPSFLWILNAFFMYVLLKRLVGKGRTSMILTTIYIAGTFELYFLNRYSFAAPLFALSLMLLLTILKSLTIKKSELFLFVLLFTALTFSHIMFAFFIIILTTIYYIVILITKKNRYTTFNKSIIYIFFFIVILFNLWYIMIYHSFFGPVKALINSIEYLSNKSETPMLVQNLVSINLRKDYYYMTIMRMFIGFIMLFSPVIIFIKVLTKNSLFQYLSYIKKLSNITKSLYVMYILIILMIFVWTWGKFTGSLRPYQISTVVVIVLLSQLLGNFSLNKIKNKKIPYTFKFGWILILILAPFIMWGPNLTYVNISSHDINMFEFIGDFAPEKSKMYGINLGYLQIWLLHWIYSNRSDISLSGSVDVRFNTSINIYDIEKECIITLTGYSLRYEAKFEYNPSLIERLNFLELKFYNLDKVYDTSNFRNIFMK